MAVCWEGVAGAAAAEAGGSMQRSQPREAVVRPDGGSGPGAAEKGGVAAQALGAQKIRQTHA